MEEIKSRPFIVRSYRGCPVRTKQEDERTHCPYHAMAHDPETDEALGQGLRDNVYKLLDRVADDGQVYEIVIRPTGETSDLARVPWVLVRAHGYGPNPHGEPVDETLLEPAEVAATKT